MKDSKPNLRREVALFRFSVIMDLLSLPAGSAASGVLMRDKASRTHLIPGTYRTRIAVETIRDWLRAYRDFGFDALYPKRRSDRGKQRRLPPEVVRQLVEIKERDPNLAVREVIRRARAGGVPEEVNLAPSTVYRLLRHEGLTDRAGEPPPKDRRRFAYREAGELWMSDVMHGPAVGSDGDDKRRRRKTYLIAFLDDATRVIPHAAFAFSESADRFLPVFKQALIRRGLPLRLYVDNGASYRSLHLAVICASLGISLIHARPYQPAGKGKIERFFRTLRGQFLPLLGSDDTGSLAAINRRLGAWIEGEYHRTPHRGLDDQTPLDRWALCADNLRQAGPEIDLNHLFRYQFKRRVGKDRTVTLQGTLYEVDASLVGHNVILLQDPAAPRQRAIPVRHQGRDAGFATLLDAYANTRVKRSGLVRPAGTAPEPPPSPLELHQLDRRPKRTRDPQEDR